jgi:hypothetical protein
VASIASKVARLISPDREGIVEMLFENRVEELILRSLEELVSQDRKKTLVEIGRNWDFYYGDHEGYFKKYREEDQDEYADKAKPEFNYTRLIIDEYIKGVMGQGVTVKINDDAVQEWWDGLVKTFNFQNYMKKLQRISELSYDCLVIPRWDKELKRVYFEEVRGEYVKYFPDPENPKQIGAIAIAYLYDTGLASNDAASLLKRIELWSKQRIYIEEYSPRLRRRRVVFDEENPYKDEDKQPIIPIAVYRPDEDDNTFHGYGNAGDVSKINMFYNNIWMDLVRIVTFQSFSILFIKSATELEVALAPTRFLKSTDPEASAEYVTPDAKIEDVRKVREDFKNELLDISRVPTEVLTGSKKDLPASGFSLRVKRMPIEHLWSEKKENYAVSIQDMVTYARIVQNTHGKQVGEQKDPEMRVLYKEVKIPEEAQTEQLKDAFELEHGLTSPVELYMKRHKTSRAEAEEAVLRNLEETKVIRERLGLTEEGRPKDTDFLSKLDALFGPPEEPVVEGNEE